ncbi:class I SAM-dependent methyltransferase [Kineococcus rhizosphaerae]|uniref:Methyltransferase family protein n=1 Tax=Kineococcus rhizosphaerae TaxID=559628 RepID=A0A2T0R0N9_9ACTN|nr:class I SAM-dependent methyltransferase [Kineococcus rhizosphaerae]PRY12858.1 methyltransferase family protein [Kineococcus rhizosphaerae]
MPDALFADPRLAVLHDLFEDPARPDLDPYLVRATREPRARRVVDVGCGTGVLAARLARAGLDVVGVDPAAASLAVARDREPRVRWLQAGAADLPALAPDLEADLAVMTGNVAQVFTTDTGWDAALAGVARALRPGGRLVFETRRPAARDWENWSTATQHRDVPGTGHVTKRFELLDVTGALVTFRNTFDLAGTVVVSESTLRFRDLPELEGSLRRNGFTVQDVGQAPDRPGLEFVVEATRARPVTAR